MAIVLQPPLALRAGIDLLKAINVSAPDGHLVPLSDLVKGGTDAGGPQHLPQKPDARGLCDR